MAISAVVNKCSFEARLDSGDLAFINVGFLLFSCAVFDIQIIELLTINHRDAHFFSVRSIN